MARLLLILGDQLDHHSLALRKADPARDTVLMMEVTQESTHVPSHRARTVLFLSAMRHFARTLQDAGWRVHYVALDDPANTQSFAGEVQRACKQLSPQSVLVVEPGEHRVRAQLEHACAKAGVPIQFVEDQHFLTTHDQFDAWAKDRRETVMEYFYRDQRRRLNILMEPDGTTPISGQWNYDHDNRKPFGKHGPSPKPRPPRRCEPDAITMDVIACVRRMLPDLPGRDEALNDFAWPVSREQALLALRDFIRHRLPLFGPYEDAMWTGERALYHSLLSSSLNLKLLHPRECVDAALKAYEKGLAPLQSVEAFVRQLIGWREFIRGVYFREGADYETRNYLEQHATLPEFYWSAETDMACMRECIGQVLDTGHGHHIQRLMVTGNFALISGVHPKAISDWYLGMYVDGIDWVTLPNTLGMVMHADGITPAQANGKQKPKGPVVGTKPYAGGGAYINKMSNYCKDCRYDPAKRTGDDACPFTVFYWDFMRRNRERFAKNPRTAQLLGNLDRFGTDQVQQITVSARRLRDRFGIASPAGHAHAPTARRKSTGDASRTQS